jgi:chitinase
VVVYHQTHHGPNDGPPVSLLPLLTHATGVTHIIIAAIHLNDPPGHLTLNDHPPSHARFTTLWAETAWLQAAGVRILGMLGGAAQGSFARLATGDPTVFESHYIPLREMIRTYNLDGLDLDIEEPTDPASTVRLIDRLRADFGADFLVTLAPVASALLPGKQPHLSGPDFHYAELERLRGKQIAWYNAQFYCGWGDAATTRWYDAIVQGAGWAPWKIVMGLVTNPGNGAGYVEWPALEATLRTLRARYPDFGGVMGWEYFNSWPGREERPWEWAARMAATIRTVVPLSPPVGALALPPPPPPPPPPPAVVFPLESIQFLVELGFPEQQAIAALRMTGGNVDYAAGLLFEDS